MLSQLIRSRRAWLVAAVVVLLVVAGSAVVVWRAGQGGCAAAVPEVDGAELPPVVAPAQLGDALDTYGAGAPDESALEFVSAAEAPIGPPRYALLDAPSVGSVQPAGDTLLVVAGNALWALDGADGATQWLREPAGPGGSAQWLGDRVAFVSDRDRRLMVATVDPSSGELLACDELGQSAEGGAAPVAASTAGGALMLLREQEDGEHMLSMVDQREPDPVQFEREVDLPVIAAELRTAAGVVVANYAPDDVQEAWELATDGRRQVTPDLLPLRAFSATDGAPAWEYAHDTGPGGAAYVHQIVGATGELVVVLAMRLDDTGEELEQQVVVLDAATGTPRWSQVLPPVARTRAPEARRYGEVVLARERGPDGDALVGYALATGEEQWRIPNPLPGLAHGAHLAGTGTALLPGRNEEGLVAMDLATGDTRRLFDGASVTQVVADEETIAVTFLFDGLPTLVTYDRV